MNDKTQVVKNRKDIRDLLVSSQSQDVFKAILPQHFTAERMIRLAIAAVTRTPKLSECHPMTLLGAFIECAALGLEPNSPLQHVHLLPFWNSKLDGYEITRIIGYRGYIELAYRTQKQVSLHADCVWRGDDFDFSYGSETFIRHPLWAPSSGGGGRVFESPHSDQQIPRFQDMQDSAPAFR